MSTLIHYLLLYNCCASKHVCGYIHFVPIIPHRLAALLFVLLANKTPKCSQYVFDFTLLRIVYTVFSALDYLLFGMQN